MPLRYLDAGMKGSPSLPANPALQNLVGAMSQLVVSDGDVITLTGTDES